MTLSGAPGGSNPTDLQLIETLRGFVGRQVADRITAEGNQPIEERRLVTALFADLSGFTELAGRLDAEDLLGVIDPIIAGLTRIVSRHDGYVEKFAGDALLALFGAPVAHEDDAARALAVALEMHAELPALVAGTDADALTLHIGVHTGTVVARTIGSAARMDYAVLGEAVILAQRLESLAPAGHIYVGELTRELAGPEFDFDHLGELAVKGRVAPLPAYRLVGRHAVRRESINASLVGRNAEQRALMRSLERLRRGQRTVVRLIGPAGSGKSSLLADVHRQAREVGVRCVEMFGTAYNQLPYREFRPLLLAALAARYPEAMTSEERWERLATDNGAPASVELTAVLLGHPGARDALSDRTPDALRYELMSAAMAWTADLAARAHLLMLIDNIHTLDESSAELIRSLIDDRSGPPLLLCLAGRADAHRPAIEGSDEVVLNLPRLPAADVRELVVQELVLQPDDRLLAFVDDRSSGNPLMVRETVRQLRADGLLDEQPGHIRLVAGAHIGSVPATLEAVLAARVDSLRPAIGRVATTAAAIGYSVSTELLARVVEMTADDLAGALAGLSAAGFLSSDLEDGQTGLAPRIQFDSALARDVLYSRLTTRRRRDVHRRIADAIGEPAVRDEGAAALLAEHLFLADDFAAALPWLCQVADHARRLFAHDEAVQALERAVHAARNARPDTVAGLLCELADVLSDRGEYERAHGRYVQAISCGGGAKAWAGRAAALRRQGRYADALGVLDDAAAARPDGDLRLLWCERGWTLSVSGDLPGSVAAVETGLRLAPDDDRLTGLLLLQLVRAETLLGQTAAARRHADQAIKNLENAGDLTSLCTALRLLGALQESAGELDDAAATLTRGLEQARRTGVVEEIGGCQINLGLVHSARGDHVAAAEAYRESGITFEQAGHRGGRAISYANRSYELFMVGRLPEARDLGIEALGLAEDVGNHLVAADTQHTLGLVAEASGNRLAALRHANAAIAEFDMAGMTAAAGDSHDLARRVGAG